jgi:hypothetical protein
MSWVGTNGHDPVRSSPVMTSPRSVDETVEQSSLIPKLEAGKVAHDVYNGNDVFLTRIKVKVKG